MCGGWRGEVEGQCSARGCWHAHSCLSGRSKGGFIFCVHKVTAAGRCWPPIKLKQFKQTSEQHERASSCLSWSICFNKLYAQQNQNNKTNICGTRSYRNNAKETLPGNHFLQFWLRSGSILPLCVCGLMNSPVRMASSGRLIKWVGECTHISKDDGGWGVVVVVVGGGIIMLGVPSHYLTSQLMRHENLCSSSSHDCRDTGVIQVPLRYN